MGKSKGATTKKGESFDKLKAEMPDRYKRKTKKAYESHLLNFMVGAWDVVNPGQEFLYNWHLLLICEYLMAVSKGKIKRLILNILPRYSKSTMVSQMWPCWEWAALNPSQTWVFSSYAANLSTFQSIKRRDILISEWFQGYWGDRIQFREDHNKKADFMNQAHGAMYSTSTGGSVTGMGGNRLVIDDPTDPQQALSDTVRTTTNTWFPNTFQSRLNDKINGTIVMIQQRLHQQDMTGFLTKLDSHELDGMVLQNNGWVLIRIPLICERDETIYSPLDGRKIWEFHEGEILWPSREGPEQIEEYKQNEYTFFSQMQQRPTSITGAMFQRDWVQSYDVLPHNIDAWIMSVDTTFKGKTKLDKNDFVAIEVWAYKRPYMYLDHVVREKLSFTQSVEAIRTVLSAYPNISTKLIEDSANGEAIIDSLQQEIGGFLPWPAVGNKSIRAAAVTPYWKGKQVFVRNAPWRLDFDTELLNFPGVQHDDQVDAMSQALDYINRTFGNLGKTRKAYARYVDAGLGARALDQEEVE